jgi:stage V sporulation protein B
LRGAIFIKKIFKAVFIITAFSVLTRLGGFVFRIFLSRQIGAEGMGLYQITMSVFGMLITLTSSGLPLVVSKRSAEMTAKKNVRGIYGTVAAALIIGLAVSGVAVIFIYIFRGAISGLFADGRNGQLLIVLLPAVVVSSFYSAFRGGLWGQQKFFSYGLLEFLEQYARIGVGVIMLQGLFTVFQGSMRAAISLSVSYFIAAAVAGAVYYINGGRLSNPRAHFKPVLKSAAPLTLVRIAGGFLSSLIALIVPLRLLSYGLNQNEALSLFGSAAGMAMPLLSIPITLVGALALALVPEISIKAGVNNVGELKSSINGAIKFSIILGGLFVAAFVAVGPSLSTLLFNDSQSGGLVRLGAFSIIPTGLTVITSSILNSLGQELNALKCYVAGSLALLACAWFLPPLLGINAMIAATYVSMTITSVLNIIMLNKTVKVAKAALRSALTTVLLIVPVAAISYFLFGLLAAIMSAALAVTAILGISTGLYFLMCIVFGLVDISAAIVTLKGKGAQKINKGDVKDTRAASGKAGSADTEDEGGKGAADAGAAGATRAKGGAKAVSAKGHGIAGAKKARV